jgi:CubicO group peptidase (beta-lactamase class C family)
MKRLSLALVIIVAAVSSAKVFTKPLGDRNRQIDAVFSRFTRATPGCAVGIAENGTPTFTRGYGMADLEHDVPITPDSIFEAGSVSKQFTAAAMLLLAHDGRLSLEDPVRTYIPELRDYGKPLLIRHILNHTSGLRDWGSVAAIAGWPRTSRVHTHAHVLDIVHHQESLNFPPGERFSYSNTGFNLAAIIVARVSGKPFPEFTHERLFAPLDMESTSWRDDFTRVVKGRAIAYEEQRGVFHTDMPFENVYGNGGLLTTVGDLLKWNENFTRPAVGDARFVEEQQTPGHFNDGRRHGYGLGLYVGTHRGLREVYHSGSTAGYSAFLTRFPEQRTSVAVLCNLATNATALAHDVSDIVLGERLKPDEPPAMPTARELYENAGLYKSELTGRALIIGRDSGVVRGRRWAFDSGRATATDQFGSIERYTKVVPAHPSTDALAVYTGSYVSVDAETEVSLTVEDGRLVLHQRPATVIQLTPLYADAFDAKMLGTIIYHRDANGRPTEFSVVQDRVWNMPFVRSRNQFTNFRGNFK